MYQHFPFHDPEPVVRHGGSLRDRAALRARIGMWECDLATETLCWTDGVYDLFGLPRGITVDRSVTVGLYEVDSRRDMERLRAEAIRSGGSFTLDAQIRTIDGEPRWMRLSAEVDYEDGRPVRLFGVKQDITEERRAWDRLRRLAERDPLTGLANRGTFEAMFRERPGSHDDEAPIAALLLIDIDHFKWVNDRFGHAAGDECLRQIATRIARLFSDAALVARIGGDEFAVLLRAPLAKARICPQAALPSADLERNADRCRHVGGHGARRSPPPARSRASLRRGRFRALCREGGGTRYDPSVRRDCARTRRRSQGLALIPPDRIIRRTCP